MGSACARRLVAEGWSRLLLTDLSAERLEALARDLRSAGAEVDILVGDIAEAGWAGALVSALGEQPISALIHTAGLSPRMADPARILAVNLDATVRLVEAVRERMAAGSAAVLFASNSSYFPLPPEAAAAFSRPLPEGGALALLHFAPDSQTAYPLSKLGVRALAKREARHFGERGSRLVSMSPGAIDTPMTQGDPSMDNDVVRTMIDTSASGRLGRPEELAAVAVFMVSPEASFVAATDWLVDGGHTAALGL